MNLSPETLARERPQRYPMESAQAELSHMPPPMTANRAKDFKRPCEKCEIAECRCIGWKAFDAVS